VKFIELFAGIGGFRYGLEGCSTKNQRRENKIGNKKGWFNELNNRSSNRLFTCVWANEIDKYACKIYRKNFGKEELYEGDIRTVKPNEIPNHDLLTAGFPCQAFSIAGKRKGFDDTRGTLFFEIGRVLQHKKPGYFILENVKGLLSHNKGRTFETIITSLAELGYDLQWQVLNSKNFGVPQNRERVFIVGHLRGKRKPEVFPIREGCEVNNEKNGQRYSYCVQPGDKHRGTHIQEKEGKLIYEGAVMSEKNKKWLEDGKQLSRNFPQGQRVYSVDGIASTITGNKTGLYMVNLHQKRTGENTFIRRLTPLECERLQGFPDGWTEGISDTQRYKCLGNAVTTNVITWIGKRLVQEVLPFN